MTIMQKEDNKEINTKHKKKRKKKKQHLLFYKLLSFLLIILTVITLGHMIIENIFTIFYMIPIILVSFIIVFIISFILNKTKLRAWLKNIISFIAIILIVLEILLILFGTKTLKFLSTITDTGYRVETFGVYVLNNSEYDDISDLDGKKIIYINHEDDTSIREALEKVKDDVNVESDYLDSIDEVIESLIDKDTDAILIDTSYESILEEEFNEYYSKIKLLKEYDVVSIVNTIKSDVDITKDTFIVYISGIDTSGNVASKARSDVNILLAINPKTHNILMINTPRDYYVTLHTKQKKDKLTHAGLYGVEESLMTLEDLYDIDIDYYARVNFTSFVKIVDALDGINVNVPISFCEQNSKRSSASGDEICLNKGSQTLNGEQALALARHRHSLPTGDRGRGENQMLVLEAIINKAMSPKILSKYSSLIDALNGRVTTNMTTNEMFKFAKKQLSSDANWNFYSISATGSDSTGVCYVTGSGKAYVMEPDEDSVNNIKTALNSLFNGDTTLVMPE